MTVLVDLRRKLEMLQFWHGFIVNVVLQQQASLHDLTETAKLLELCKTSALASALSSYKEKGPKGSRHIHITGNDVNPFSRIRTRRPLSTFNTDSCQLLVTTVLLDRCTSLG